jgi:hypothetical protein
MKTFKTLQHFERRLRNGVCWTDWIKVGGRVYKMVEYGDKYHGGNYMLFQNKPTTNIIRVDYQVPCFNKGVQTKEYRFDSIEEYDNGELYRY